MQIKIMLHIYNIFSYKLNGVKYSQLILKKRDMTQYVDYLWLESADNFGTLEVPSSGFSNKISCATFCMCHSNFFLKYS